MLQCRLHESIPSDDEYRSSRNIAISLFKRYRYVIDRGGGGNLKVYSLVYLTCSVLCLPFLSSFSNNVKLD